MIDFSVNHDCTARCITTGFTVADERRLMEPTRAAGVICRCPATGKILMVKRTDGQGWAFPGGRIEEGESPETCAMREFLEETGFRLGRITPLMRRTKDDGQGPVDFSTFVSECDAEFVPRLNSEHNAHGWFDPVDVLSGDAEPDDLDHEAGQAIIDSIDRLEARLAALGG